MTTEIYQKIDYGQPDLLLRFREIPILKFGLMELYPDIFQFLNTAYFETASEVREQVEQINQNVMQNNYQRAFENIDYSLFRDDIDLQTAISTISFTLEKWADQYVRHTLHGDIRTGNPEDALKELEPYLNLFRVSFYKEGL